jgi:hypothetical protein
MRAQVEANSDLASLVYFSGLSRRSDNDQSDSQCTTLRSCPQGQTQAARVKIRIKPAILEHGQHAVLRFGG